MDQDELLAVWRRWKERGGGYRLCAPHTQCAEFRSPQWGHPPGYAAVRFECVPAARLTFASQARWPEDLDRERCEAAVCVAVVDGLLGARPEPYRGCAVTLLEIGWDDVMSSPMAFYLATVAAMAELVAHGPWEHVGPT